MDELIIIKGCLRGDKKCQKALVESYGPFLMSVCRRYAPQSHQAEDLLQDTFLNAFKYLKTFSAEKGKLRFWLKKIAINTSLKHIAKNKLKYSDLSHATGASSAPIGLSNLSVEELMQHIESLPDGYKQIFNLSVIEGYSHKEIASMLNIKDSTSRSNLTRAKESLRNTILEQKNIRTWKKIG